MEYFLILALKKLFFRQMSNTLITLATNTHHGNPAVSLSYEKNCEFISINIIKMLKNERAG